MAEAPFTGDYPTRNEVERALIEVGFGDYTEHTVTPPMGDMRDGPLAEKLMECKSKSLSMGYPTVFKRGVQSMLEKSGVVILD